MSKKSSYRMVAILIAMALLLSACANPAADRPGKWYEVNRWFDTPLSVSLAEKCADGRAQALVGDGIYDCTGAPAGAPPYVAPEATQAPEAPPAAPEATAAPEILAPVAGTCNRDGQTVADNPNAARTDMSYFGGTSEPCYFYGEVNFGLSKDNRGLTVLMVIPPHWTLNANGFLGYAFWARESQGAVDWSIQDSTANLTRADGRAEATPLVVHVDNPEEMANLTALVRTVYAPFAYKLIPPALP